MTMRQAVLLFLLIGCVFYTETIIFASTIISQELRTLVMNSYNPDDDFKTNVLDILSIICPKSLYCENEIPDVLKYVENMLQNRTDLVSQSRRSLLENSSEFEDCCVMCSCKPDCRGKQNCCSTNIFIQTYEQNQQLECVSSDMGSRIHDSQGEAPAYYMVTTCHSTYSLSDRIRVKCENPDVTIPDEIIPVHSEKLGKIFLNIYCALCNFVSITEAWKMRIVFKSAVPFEYLPTDLYDFYRTIIRMTKRGLQANIIFSPSAPDRISTLLEPCVPFNVKCICPCKQCDASNVTIENALSSACKTTSTLFQSSKAYQNAFCLMCQYSKNEMEEDCSFKIKTLETGYITGLLDFRSSNERSRTKPLETTYKRCNCTDWYDKVQGICRPVLCPVFERRIHCECRRWVTNVTGVGIDIRISLRTSDEDEDALEADTSLLHHVVSTLKRFIGTFHFNESSFESSYLCCSDTGQFLYFVFILKNDNGYDIRDDVKMLYNQLMSNPVITVKKSKFIVSLGAFYKLDVHGTELINDKNMTNCTYLKHEGVYSQNVGLLNFERFNKLLYCEQVKILPHELDLLANVSDKFRSIGEHYFMSYLYDRTRSVMCLEDLVHFVDNESSANLSTYTCMFKLVLLVVLYHL